jgi:hypothetical protein
MAMTPEGRVKKRLKEMFEGFEPELYYFMPVQSGYGSDGLDFHCSYLGHAFVVETKAPGQTLTPRQRSTKRRIERSHTPVFVCSNDEHIAFIRSFLWNIRPPTTT